MTIIGYFKKIWQGKINPEDGTLCFLLSANSPSNCIKEYH